MKRTKSHKFSLIANFANSMRGIVEVAKNERPMQVEIACFVLFSIILIFLDLSFGYKAILFISLFLPLFAEVVNSSIERAVDLITLEYHDLAKAAKDAASAGVLIALIVTGLIWASVIYINYFGG